MIEDTDFKTCSGSHDAGVLDQSELDSAKRAWSRVWLTLVNNFDRARLQVNFGVQKLLRTENSPTLDVRQVAVDNEVFGNPDDDDTPLFQRQSQLERDLNFSYLLNR